MLWTTFDFRPVNAWEKRKLGDVVERVTRKNKNIESTLPLTISAQNGLVDQRTFFSKTIAGKDTKNYLLLKSGEFAYNRSYSVGNPWGAVRRLDRYPSGILSSLYIAFKPLEIDSQFLVAYFNGSSWYRAIRKVAAEGARNHGLLNISASDFFDQEMMIPAEQSEQEIIGFTLDKVDDLIAATQDKLDCLERVKKALLQHLFDQSMRFKGYSDPWEKRKLGSIGKIKSGSGFPSIEQGGKQGIPFYKVSDMNTSGNKNSMVISQNYVTSAQLKKRKWTPITNTPAIIFAKVGAAIFLDRKRVVEHPFLIDNNMMAYIVGDAWNLRFCQAFFQSIPLLKFAQTGALPSLNAHDIGRIPVHLPTRYEQKEIGDLIYKVTRLIAATQSKLSSLESLKKALLQGLFI